MGVASSTRTASWYDCALEEASLSKYNGVHVLLVENHEQLQRAIVPSEVGNFYQMAKQMIDVLTEDSAESAIRAVLFVMHILQNSGRHVKPTLRVDSRRAEYQQLLSNPLTKWGELTSTFDEDMRERVLEVGHILEESNTKVPFDKAPGTAKLAMTASAFVFVINSYQSAQNCMFSRVVPYVNGASLPPPASPPPTSITPPPERKEEPASEDEDEEVFMDAHELTDDAEEGAITWTQRQQMQVLLLLPLVKPYKEVMQALLHSRTTRDVVTGEQFTTAVSKAAYADLSGNQAGALQAIRKLATTLGFVVTDLATARTTTDAFHLLLSRLAAQSTKARVLIRPDIRPPSGAVSAVQQRWSNIIRDVSGVDLDAMRAKIAELQAAIATAPKDVDVDHLARCIEFQEKLHQAKTTRHVKTASHAANIKIAKLQAQLSVLQARPMTPAEDATKVQLQELHELQLALADSEAKLKQMEAIHGKDLDQIDKLRTAVDATVRNADSEITFLKTQIQKLEGKLDASNTTEVEALRKQIASLERKLESSQSTEKMFSDIVAALRAANYDDAISKAAQAAELQHNLQELQERYAVQEKQLEATAKLQGRLGELAHATVYLKEESVIQKAKMERVQKAYAAVTEVIRTNNENIAAAMHTMQFLAVPQFQNDPKTGKCRVIMRPLPHETFDVESMKEHILSVTNKLAAALKTHVPEATSSSSPTFGTDRHSEVRGTHLDVLCGIKFDALGEPVLTMVQVVELFARLREIGVEVGTFVCGEGVVADTDSTVVTALGNLSLQVFKSNSHLFSQQTVQHVRALMAHGVVSLTPDELKTAYDLLRRALETGLTAIKLEKLEDGETETAARIDEVLTAIASGEIKGFEAFKPLLDALK